MAWWPDLEFGWLNGWIPLALLALTDGVLFLIFPRAVVRRLFDRSGWTRRQVVFTVAGKLCALGCLLLLIFTSLKLGSAVFVIGVIVVGLGLTGLVKALVDFRNTPFGEPVARGIYQVSRHPQIVMSSVVILGACIAVGSWAALLLLALARGFSHFGILAEEEVCLRQYGETYRTYMQRVPRYFVIF
ncbi:MAG: DUF1295 domain-containing protein [Anaerolineae bacterium]|nr:DUF1295 domain-containing protein [Anaerolineae bacterium]